MIAAPMSVEVSLYGPPKSLGSRPDDQRQKDADHVVQVGEDTEDKGNRYGGLSGGDQVREQLGSIPTVLIQNPIQWWINSGWSCCAPDR